MAPGGGPLGKHPAEFRKKLLRWEDMDRGEFFLCMFLLHQTTHFRWEVIVVYGPTDQSRSAAFLAELQDKVNRCQIPVVITEDF